MKLTEWYPGHIKPVRVGVYEVKSVLDFCETFRPLWGGKQWVNEISKIIFFEQFSIWRGITK